MAMVEVAAEELGVLASEHSGQFGFLKHEINAFVAGSPVHAFCPSLPDAVQFIDTQVSSSTDDGERKRNRGVGRGERQRKRKRDVCNKDSADFALEMAVECLRKTRTLNDRCRYCFSFHFFHGNQNDW